MQYIHTNNNHCNLHYYRIYRLREVGILQILYERQTQYLEKDDTLIRAMSLPETWFIFAICGIGIIVSTFFLCLELLTKIKLTN